MTRQHESNFSHSSFSAPRHQLFKILKLSQPKLQSNHSLYSIFPLYFLNHSDTISVNIFSSHENLSKKSTVLVFGSDKINSSIFSQNE